MRRGITRLAAVVALGLLVVLVGCSRKPEPTKDDKPHVEPGGPARPNGGPPRDKLANWVEFSDPEKTLKMQFPSQPTAKKIQKTSIYEVKSPNAEFRLEYEDLADGFWKDFFPGASKEELPNKILDYLAKGPEGHTISRTPIQIGNNYHAVDMITTGIRDDGSPGKSWERHILVRKRLFILRVSMRQGQEDEPAAKKFLTTFQIINEAPIPMPPP